ncbi:MAG: efflux RND transporter periplasmic adaptor subunit [Proteobacteria bacterium]|nr:efflux RND transporter periplasmic adaptor subunit [Pseudomonadota bacterium]
MALRLLAGAVLACVLALPTTVLAGDAEVAATARVQVAPATRAPLHQHLSAYGMLAFSGDGLRALSVPYQAQVASVAVTAGQSVRKGQALLVLRPTAASVLELQRADNDAVFARNELQRTRTLFTQHLATNADLAAAELAAHNAQAAQVSAHARLGSASEHTLRGTSDGVVVDITVRGGDVIAADMALAHVGATSGLRLELGVEPTAIAQVRVGQAVSFRLLRDGAPAQSAHVERIGSQIDAVSRLIPVVAKPDDGADLPPGAAVRALISFGSGQGVLGVPRAAVLRRDGRAYVFVVRAGRAVRRWVTVGDDDGERVEIRAGLQAGEAVVVLGNYELSDGMAVRVQ